MLKSASELLTETFASPDGTQTFYSTRSVGSDGFVRYVDRMGDESSIVQAARVSYGQGTKTVSDDVGLVRYLMRHRHSTPFEMVEMKFHVRVPMDCWRQWVRHRTASINEYSTRYSEAIDSASVTMPEEWRKQSLENRQGSSQGDVEWPHGYNFEKAEGDAFAIGHLEAIPDTLTPREYLTDRESLFLQEARQLYKERLEFGISREQARKDLPLSTYTEAYWKCDLHNILNFLSLRLDSHAQLEIREYAQQIAFFVEILYPNVWAAFCDYRLNSITLSAKDIEAIRLRDFSGEVVFPCIAAGKIPRERKEFLKKVEKLGLTPDDHAI